jgi:hypothetical protein
LKTTAPEGWNTRGVGNTARCTLHRISTQDAAREPKGKCGHYQGSGLYSRIILKRKLNIWMGKFGLRPHGSLKGPVAGSCEDGNEHFGSIKCWKIVE